MNRFDRDPRSPVQLPRCGRGFFFANYQRSASGAMASRPERISGGPLESPLPVLRVEYLNWPCVFLFNKPGGQLWIAGDFGNHYRGAAIPVRELLARSR